MARLNTYVHVDGRAWGPDDEVPDEVAARIRAPGVWADGGEPNADSQQAESGTGSGAESVRPASGSEPPRAGRGSSREAWAAYAVARGVEVSDGMQRDDIIAAVDKAAGSSE